MTTADLASNLTQIADAKADPNGDRLWELLESLPPATLERLDAFCGYVGQSRAMDANDTAAA